MYMHQIEQKTCAWTINHSALYLSAYRQWYESKVGSTFSYICCIFVYPDLDSVHAFVCWNVEKVCLFVQIYMYISESWDVLQATNKQLLDEVFEISRIIKVEVEVISWRLKPRPWLFWISQKPNLILFYYTLNKKKNEVMFLLLHWWQATQRAQT